MNTTAKHHVTLSHHHIHTRALAEHKKLLDEYKKAVDASSLISRFDTNRIITYVNDEQCRISGYSAQELVGSSVVITRSPNTPAEKIEAIWQTLYAKKIWRGIIENRRKDGSSYFIDATIVPILGVNDEITEFIRIGHDVTPIVEGDENDSGSSLMPRMP
ncbi:MAG: PAS domain S-box protein [Campylobacterales bacterium]